MSTKISGSKYAAMYGPTTGDKVRLADTSLVIARQSVTVWDSL